MRNQGAPLGGVDKVQETMDDLQAELQSAQDITDAINRIATDAFGVVAASSGAGCVDGMSEEELMSELDALLLLEEEDNDREVLTLQAAAAHAPSASTVDPQAATVAQQQQQPSGMRSRVRELQIVQPQQQPEMALY